MRIADNMAWVDDDGFETPVLLRECVVVRRAHEDEAVARTLHEEKPDVKAVAPKPVAKEKDKPKITNAPEEKIRETPGGEKINITLAFEPKDRLKLTETDYDAYLVNDSNYFIYFTFSARENDNDKWRCHYAGLVEPDTELWLGTYAHADVLRFERIALQYIAFKKGDREYTLKVPRSVEKKVDTTKFVKLHCLKRHKYFPSDVLAFDMVIDDEVEKTVSFDSLKVEKPTRRQNDFAEKGTKFPGKKSDRHIPQRPASNEPLVVDLHINSLLDNTAGMSAADILNHQVDVFRRIMDENLRNYGKKIVFIHGKGEGVLRNSLEKELTHRYKGHEVQDASFGQYGYGAKQVTIRQHPDKFASKKAR